MFHDETMPSFFRRPSYSPDGSLLIVPGQLSLSNNKHCYIASKTFTQQNEHCDWLILGHMRAPDQIQMFPDRDTIAQLLPSRRILLI